MASFRFWRRRPPAADVTLPPPQIDADRCVHSRVVEAACRCCVDACPIDAWSFSEQELSLDTAQCDGCGLCVAACPEAALSHAFAPLPLPQAGVAFAACQRVAAVGEPGVVPCVHGIGEQRVYAYALQGIATLNVARDDCDACPRGRRQRVERTLENAARVLRSRGLPAVTVEEMPVDIWRRSLRSARAHQDMQPARRRFLSLALPGVASPPLDADQDAPAGHTLPASHGLPRAAGVIHPWVPRIDANQCVACDACIRICPTGALSEQPEQSAYGLDASRCTGCGLCRDVCEFSAVSVHRLEAASQVQLAFAVRHCRACGADYIVVGTAADDGMCRICRITQRNRQLFQVIRDR